MDPAAVYGNDLTALMWAAGHTNDAPVADGTRHGRAAARGRGAGRARRQPRPTALMIAAERDHPEIVARLLAAGADPAVRDRDGRTAADLAASAAVREALAGD